MIRFREAEGARRVRMPRAVAVELAYRRIAAVSPTESADEWMVTGVTKVGMLRIAGEQVLIDPKTPVSRLLDLLGARPGAASADQARATYAEDSLVPAAAALYADLLAEAVARGLVGGYRSYRIAEPTIRGRMEPTEQLRRRVGLAVPQELSVDEFVTDTDLNRVLVSALERLLSLPGVPVAVRQRLSRLRARFGGVMRLVPGARLPSIALDRRTQSFEAAGAFARLVLTGSSIELRTGTVSASGLLIDMPPLFEAVVLRGIAAGFGDHGGRVLGQYSDALDSLAQVGIRPDIVWMSEGRVAAVFDAKYKVLDGTPPNTDIYQAAAYAARYGLGDVHLIYAGGAAGRRVIELVGTATRVHVHTADLGSERHVLDAEFARIAALAGLQAEH